MAEKSTVARPYAEAVFSQAQDDGQLKEWSEMLQMARSVATDPAMAAIIILDLSPSSWIPSERATTLITSSSGKRDPLTRGLRGQVATYMRQT